MSLGLGQPKPARTAKKKKALPPPESEEGRVLQLLRHGPCTLGQLSDAVVFAVLIVVLLVRPAGLLGKQIREKV
mgnify:CR=1 FL=1